QCFFLYFYHDLIMNQVYYSSPSWFFGIQPFLHPENNYREQIGTTTLNGCISRLVIKLFQLLPPNSARPIPNKSSIPALIDHFLHPRTDSGEPVPIIFCYFSCS